MIEGQGPWASSPAGASAAAASADAPDASPGWTEASLASSLEASGPKEASDCPASLAAGGGSGTTLASPSGQPLWFHVQVNSVSVENAHSSGRDTHCPPLTLKHHPQPTTGVHVPHDAYWPQPAGSATPSPQAPS